MEFQTLLLIILVLKSELNVFHYKGANGVLQVIFFTKIILAGKLYRRLLKAFRSLADLSYNIARYTIDLDKNLIDMEIGRAFKVWSEFTPLTFNHKRTGPVHIELLFATGDHGDGQPFDGPGKTLAHAFFPQFGGWWLVS